MTGTPDDGATDHRNRTVQALADYLRGRGASAHPRHTVGLQTRARTHQRPQGARSPAQQPRIIPPLVAKTLPPKASLRDCARKGRKKPENGPGLYLHAI